MIVILILLLCLSGCASSPDAPPVTPQPWSPVVNGFGTDTANVKWSMPIGGTK